MAVYEELVHIIQELCYAHSREDGDGETCRGFVKVFFVSSWRQGNEVGHLTLAEV
jgi:hypothetical protein